LADTPALLVTGATGLIGSALAARRPTVPLPRRAPPGGGPWWSPLEGAVHDAPAQVGAVVHLAGAPVTASRWTPDHKAAIRDSRTLGTRTIVDWIASRKQRPAVLVSASAIGLYGDRGDTPLDESAGQGEGFLADVVAAWEAEAERVRALGVRLVILRVGIVLSPDGGALAEMLPAFRLGAGGPLGSGRQWFPWIHIDDVLNIIDWALRDPGADGAYNVVAPGIVRQKAFAKALGARLGRPALVPAPKLALRLMFGRQMATEALLSSVKVVPRRLEAAGFAFQHPTVTGALASLSL